MQKSANHFIDSQNEINENIENENPFIGAEQIRIEVDLEKLKTERKEEILQRLQSAGNDVQGLHDIYHNLNVMVHDQKQAVDNIEANVEDAKENVNEGLADIIKTYK